MGTATVLHLLSAVPEADPPDPGTIISASTPNGGVLTTTLLDPASPTVGYTQAVHEVKASGLISGGGTFLIIFGRYLTKPLPAQTIGSGNWKLTLNWRIPTVFSGTITSIKVGACLAQWRSGTGVVARFFDNTAASASFSTGAGTDYANTTTIAGASETLLANDCLVLEVWTQILAGTASTMDLELLFNGLGQYFAGAYTLNQLTDTDGVLKAPAAITFF